MSSVTQDKKTIGIILGLIFPGVGHIYLGGKKERRRGIKIAIVFVIISSVSEFLVNFLQLYNLFEVRSIPMIIIWIWQIRDLIKITEKSKDIEEQI